MEVVVAEEKKKIFRARKTMKMSDRLQLESLHSTLLTSASSLSSPSPPPLMNGTHKDDGQKAADKEQNNISGSNSPNATSPVSQTPVSSPVPFLSLNLSPSPPGSQSPKDQEVTSPRTPAQSAFFDCNKAENEDSSPALLDESSSSTQPKKDTTGAPLDEEEQEKKSTTEHQSVDTSPNDSASSSHAAPVESEFTRPIEGENDSSTKTNPDPFVSKVKDGKPYSPKASSSSTSLSKSHSDAEKKKSVDVKEESIKDEKTKKILIKRGFKCDEKMEVDLVKEEVKKEKREVGQTTSRPSSTPPSHTGQEKSSSSTLKRTLSEGSEIDVPTVKREGKRPKVEHEELEAQLELKISAKAGNHHKLEKIVQQLVEERLKIMELTVFDKNFQELKARVDKIDCANKHQTALSSLQTKISRLAKKFGEANQASENKRKQEALAAAAAAVAAPVAAPVATTTTTAATAPKTTTVTTVPQPQRPVRATVEVKQTPTVPSSSSAVVSVQAPLSASVAASTTSSTSTAMVPQGSILQLITSSANSVSTLATGITTQSQPGTLVLKTAPGSSMVAAGQPLVIQLPLSMNGQTGTLVNFPVSSLSAATSLTKAKTTPSTTTFILKPSPATNPVSVSSSVATTLPTIQASAGQVSSTQISLARAVYQGGAGGITTPNAGVSVTTARTPAQSVSVVGALSSASSPATSVPAATGSTAPGPPQGTSLTSKTDNQTTVTTPAKVVVPIARPKGSVIDLTEDDDDVQVTGVKNATVAPPSPALRSNAVTSISTGAAARMSPKTNQNPSNPQITVHHRPPQDAASKPRPTTSTPTRGPGPALPSLPVAPAPPRLPPEAERTSPPQQLQLKLVPGQTGIVLSWSVAEVDRSCAAVESYHLYAFHQDNSNSGAAQQHWKKIGEVNALPLPMACTLTQFQSGSTYYFAVRAKDIYGRFGTFCEPQCTNVITSTST
ncbi:activating transcription factor 7-interacting protein 1 [Oryzias melastigma]|uniref:Activating transcription factor 7 interacting protein n=1 Tax=Oryzias melastigma TaxID=30732 RepID=A0A3B3DPQ7_ORYME|nr:activating transcription factor 7-interacting protein 1 [Oryzias melastigma]XP_024145614.1 activating transcription factor 7-interacting protein 1 [Oryzias melastigma]